MGEREGPVARKPDQSISFDKFLALNQGNPWGWRKRQEQY